MSLAGCQINPIDVYFHHQKSLEIQLTKSNPKNDRGWKVPSLMPIRVKKQWQPLIFTGFLSKYLGELSQLTVARSPWTIRQNMIKKIGHFLEIRIQMINKVHTYVLKNFPQMFSYHFFCLNKSSQPLDAETKKEMEKRKNAWCCISPRFFALKKAFLMFVTKSIKEV